MERIRIGTRNSRLAMAQSQIVAQSLMQAHSDLEVQLVPIVTSGDRRRGSLAGVGGKGLFTVELEEGLRSGRIDAAVHSAKDLPTDLDPDLLIAGVPERGDPRDALVTNDGVSLVDLPAGGKVGTGSLRRAAQIVQMRGDLEVVPIRGNVETRVSKILQRVGDSERLDAVVLAMAGLQRSGLCEAHRDRIVALPVDSLTPAAGQGTLAIEALVGNHRVRALIAAISDPLSVQALHAERYVVDRLGADCHSCIGVYVRAEQSVWLGAAVVGGSQGRLIRCEATASSPDQVAEQLVSALCEQGGAELLKN
jgi:hydroxymethylbilane synthase